MLNSRFSQIEMPERIKTLLVSKQGIPVPWFVQWLYPDGRPAKAGATGALPEFRIMDEDKRIKAIEEGRCWICGHKLEFMLAFVAGPMCAVNRASSEPPSHRECAEYSVKACPFLVMPKMVRRENDLPENHSPGGMMCPRNPGVAMIWMTKDYRVVPAYNGYVIRMGDPLRVLWFAEGRQATHDEVKQSIEDSIPILAEAVLIEFPDPNEQAEARRDLETQLARVAKLMPR